MFQVLIRLMMSLALLIISSPALAGAEIIDYNIVTDEFYGLNAERVLLEIGRAHV